MASGSSGNGGSPTTTATGRKRPGAPRRDARATTGPDPGGEHDGRPTATVRLRMEVVWDDIGNADADMVAVGHYQDVYPTASEAALDRAISGSDAADEHVLGVATTRGVLAGLLGEVSLFPWERGGGRRGMAATVGLGRPGTFGLLEHEVVVRNLLWTAEHAVGARTLDCSLIGAGSGNLEVSDALESMVRSIDVAARERELTGGLGTIRIIEFELGRARHMHDRLQMLLADRADAPVAIDLGPHVVEGARGVISAETALLELLVATAAEQTWPSERVGGTAASPRVRDGLAAALAGLASTGLEDFKVLRRGEVALRKGAKENATPTRLSVLVRDGELWASALSDSATVPERRLGLELKLFEAMVHQANLEAGDRERAGALLLRLTVPAEFRSLLCRGGSTVLEVDRVTAELPWEILPADREGSRGRRYLGLGTALARQLRTTLSQPPTVTGRVALRRVLVVGDPGRPGGGGHLPGARREADHVVTVLRDHGVHVDCLLGADGDPSAAGNLRPATLANVLHHLLHYEYDVVHYAGHGTFSSEDAARASGWVLSDGVLRASHLTMVERLPVLLVANACHSSRMSTGLPGLADEFIGRGVRNLVGTARAVDDDSAELFAECFYRSLLGSAGSDDRATLGKAVLAGRQKLDERDLDWDAYHLYGDPNFRFAEPTPRR